MATEIPVATAIDLSPMIKKSQRKLAFLVVERTVFMQVFYLLPVKHARSSMLRDSLWSNLNKLNPGTRKTSAHEVCQGLSCLYWQFFRDEMPRRNSLT